LASARHLVDPLIGARQSYQDSSRGAERPLMSSLDRDDGANALDSFRNRLGATSNFLSRVGFRIPIAVVIAFVFHKEALQIVDPIFFGQTDVSHFAFLRDQYAFLMHQSAVGPIEAGDFRIFEVFIWVASIVGVLRVLTGVCSRAVLASSHAKLDRLKSKGMSTLGVLSFSLLGVPFTMFCSLNFKFSSIPQTLFLMQHLPRVFVGLMAVIFCTGVIFLQKVLLLLCRSRAHAGWEFDIRTWHRS
jgi:hypothetical protein